MSYTRILAIKDLEGFSKLTHGFFINCVNLGGCLTASLAFCHTLKHQI
jgi:hypothetical protein